jgi:hypothetical protein
MVIEAVYRPENEGIPIEGHIQQGMLTLGQAIEIGEPGQPSFRTGKWSFAGFMKLVDYPQRGDNMILLIKDTSAEQIQKGMVIRQPEFVSEDPVLLFTKKFDFNVPLSIEQCRARMVNSGEIQIVAQSHIELKFIKSVFKSNVSAIGTISGSSANSSRIVGQAGIKWHEIRLVLLADVAFVGIVFLVSHSHPIDAVLFLAAGLILLPLLLELATMHSIISSLKRHLEA